MRVLNPYDARTKMAFPATQKLRMIRSTQILRRGGGTVTPRQLKDALDQLGLTQTAAAIRLSVSLRTMQNWCAGVHEVPGAVELLLRLWLRHPELMEEQDYG